MDATFEFDGRVALVTGVSGALGSSVAEAFEAAGGTVVGTDRRGPQNPETELEPGRVDFHQADLTDETEVRGLIDGVIDKYGRLDFLLNIAGTWAGGDPIAETDVETFDLLFAVNLRTMFLASKHAIPHLRETGGSIVSVSARSSLSGGEGDGPYRASKAGVRLLTETIAEEEAGLIDANAVMPSIIDTPANRSMLPDADHQTWVDPADIADTMLALCSDAFSVTSGAAIPVYGEA